MMRRRLSSFVPLMAALASGCGGARDLGAVQPDSSFRPDPNYIAKPNDIAVLYRPFEPRGMVPYVADLDVYGRVYDHLRRGQEELISPPDKKRIRWAPAGSRVEVLNVVDRASIDSMNHIAQQRA